MQHRLQFRSDIEVAGLIPQDEVLDETGACRDVPTEHFQYAAEQHMPAEDEAGGQDHQQCRKDAADTPGIELDEGKIASLQALEADRGAQKSRDKEEHIDADEAAGKPVGECVEADDRQYGQPAETVDIGAVVGMVIALAGCQRLGAGQSETIEPSTAA